jgi:protein phosphatase
VVKFAVKSDRGRIREINEDSYNILAGYSGVPVSFIIADGMGGHNSGEVASKMAVDFISNSILEWPEGITDADDIFGLMGKIVEKANKKVYRESLENDSNSGMGTTLTVAIIHNKKLYVAHIGDSRLYIIREGFIKRLTIDHTYVDELLRNGSLTTEEASVHPKKNLLTRALGCSENVEVDLFECSIKNNDIFMLCTDGLTNMLDEEEIKEIIEKTDELDIACNELVSRANEKGGEDNITVLLFKSEER